MRCSACASRLADASRRLSHDAPTACRTSSLIAALASGASRFVAYHALRARSAASSAVRRTALLVPM